MGRWVEILTHSPLNLRLFPGVNRVQHSRIEDEMGHGDASCDGKFSLSPMQLAHSAFGISGQGVKDLAEGELYA